MNTLNKLALSAVLTLGFTGLVNATPILSDIVDRAPSVYDNNGSYAQVIDTDGTTDTVVAALILESAGLASDNVFGIYKRDALDEFGKPDELIEIFAGASTPDSNSVTLTFNADGSVERQEFGVDTAIVPDFGTVFGFYLQNSLGTWYSDYILNDDGIDHAGFYDITGLGYKGSELIVAFEDLPGTDPSFDEDYNDLVVAISDVATVPEPATLALLGIGLVGMGVARRRRA